tara:strand:- start:728 stop:1054 length:327 start_codon:yes stop_codon:yes gene_type:complete
MLADIELGLRTIQSNLQEAHSPTQRDPLQITSTLTATIEYGRLLEAVAKLLRYESLRSLDNILRSDQLYLSGQSLSALDTSSEENTIRFSEIDQIVSRLEALENWLEV